MAYEENPLEHEKLWVDEDIQKATAQFKRALLHVEMTFESWTNLMEMRIEQMKERERP